MHRRIWVGLGIVIGLCLSASEVLADYCRAHWADESVRSHCRGYGDAPLLHQSSWIEIAPEHAARANISGVLSQLEDKASKGDERNAPVAAPQAVQRKSLAGSWRALLGNGQVRENGKNLEFINELGWVSAGRWLDSETVMADTWGVEGKISKDGKVISWSNGTRWTR